MDDLVLDEDMARFIGLFISDGNYLYEDRKNVSTFRMPKGLQFSFDKKEKNLTEFVKRFSKSRFGKQVTVKEDPRYDNNVYCYIYSTEVSRKLSKYVSKKGALNKMLFNSHPIIIASFLRGFLEGDGYIAGKEIHINDAELADDLCMLFTLIGVPVTFRKREKSQVIRIQHVMGRASHGIIRNDILYNRVPQFVVRTGENRPFYNYRCLVSKSAIEKHDAYTEECAKLLNGCFSVVKVRSREVEFLDKPIDFYDIELEKNNFFVHSQGTITHNCCRLQLNLEDLRHKTGGLFGFGESTGSLGVVTINMPRIGYTSKEEGTFFEKLDRVMYLAKNSLEIKRKLVDRMMKMSMLPYSKRYLGNFDHHFSTIGLIGMNEACLNFLGQGIASENGRNFSVRVLEFMRERLKEYQEETGHIYNLEATPGEGTSYRLAKIDRAVNPKIITYGDKLPYYTNSTMLPVDYTDDVFAALNHQEELQRRYTGGTVFHTFLGESPNSGEEVAQLVKKMASGFAIPYFTITPTFSICKNHGYIKGEHFACPTCCLPAEVYSRVVGYIRPVQAWNEGKQVEFKQRLEYKMPAISGNAF
jgi:ribonucleoside-triphosphate reductase